MMMVASEVLACRKTEPLRWANSAVSVHLVLSVQRRRSDAGLRAHAAAMRWIEPAAGHFVQLPLVHSLRDAQKVHSRAHRYDCDVRTALRLHSQRIREVHSFCAGAAAPCRGRPCREVLLRRRRMKGRTDGHTHSCIAISTLRYEDVRPQARVRLRIGSSPADLLGATLSSSRSSLAPGVNKMSNDHRRVGRHTQASKQGRAQVRVQSFDGATVHLSTGTLCKSTLQSVRFSSSTLAWLQELLWCAARNRHAWSSRGLWRRGQSLVLWHYTHVVRD
jgi:hypothetical protein